MRRLAVLLLLLAACRPGRAWDAEVAALDGLRADATTEEFLASPALRELLAAFDEAAPALRRGMESKSWSIRARCLYATCANQLYGSDGVFRGADPHPEVAAVFAQYSGACGTGGSLLLKPEIDAVVKRRPLELRGSLDWLPPELYERRLKRVFELLEEPAPLATPVKTVADGFNARLKPEVEAARDVLLQELQEAREGHAMVERILAALKAVPRDRPERLAVLAGVCFSLDNHEHPSHGSHGEDPCPKEKGYAAALDAVILERVGMESPPFLLYETMPLLASFPEGRALLKRFAESHPDPAARDSAAWHLRDKK